MDEEMAPLEKRSAESSGQSDDPIRKILSFDFSNGAFISPRCKLCSSLYRKESEKMYDDGRSLVDIKTFLDEKGDDISVSNIRHHLKEHYQNMERMAALLDYCDRLDELKRKRRSRENDLENIVNVGYMELARAISIPTNGDIGKEKIRTELILKVVGSIADTIKTLNDMEDRQEAVKAIEIKFAEAWKACIETASNEEKPLFAQALREFKRIMESQE